VARSDNEYGCAMRCIDRKTRADAKFGPSGPVTSVRGGLLRHPTTRFNRVCARLGQRRQTALGYRSYYIILVLYRRATCWTRRSNKYETLSVFPKARNPRKCNWLAGIKTIFERFVPLRSKYIAIRRLRIISTVVRSSKLAVITVSRAFPSRLGCRCSRSVPTSKCRAKRTYSYGRRFFFQMGFQHEHTNWWLPNRYATTELNKNKLPSDRSVGR